MCCVKSPSIRGKVICWKQEAAPNKPRSNIDAAQDLRQQGLASEVSVAQAKAAYDSATAAVARAQLALDNIKVTGTVRRNRGNQSLPKLATCWIEATVCATVLDDDPMLVVGLVPEQQIGKLELGAPVNAELLTGEQVSCEGHLPITQCRCPVAKLSNRSDGRAEGQRDFWMVSPRKCLLRPLTSRAHLIPPSALTLDDNGVVGVKTLNRNNIVAFNPVTVVGDQTSQMDAGVWVTGSAGAGHTYYPRPGNRIPGAAGRNRLQLVH